MVRHPALLAGETRRERKLSEEVFAVARQRFIAVGRRFGHRFTHHLRQRLVLIAGHRFKVKLHRHLLRLFFWLNTLRRLHLLDDHIGEAKSLT
ncbi:hypothetical protein D3C86_1580380 [compost metagenome]